MESAVQKSEMTILVSEGNVLKVMVQEPDEFSGLCYVELTSTVFDTYGGKWLAPRRTQLFLSREQLKQFASFLQAAA